PLRGPNTPVQAVAVDKQGKRRAVDFQFTVDSTLPAVPPPTPKMDINFGNYYALIIGNQQYLYVSKLEARESDARSIAEVLSRKYGFKTKVLLNATSQAIVQALNDFRRNMTDKDNLLIYYAGHG